MKLKNWRLSFRRWLHEDLQSQYRRLHDMLFHMVLMLIKIMLNRTGKSLVCSWLNQLTNTCVDKIMGLTSTRSGKLNFL
jgi:hypothetical protein